MMKENINIERKNFQEYAGNMYHQLDRTDKIYLYGHNQISQDASENLTARDFLVEDVIDKKIFNHNNDDARLWDCQSNVVCIVCLNNGLEHEKVANDLYHLGFDKILYLPMELKTSIEFQRIQRRAYRNFINRDYDSIIIPILSLTIKNKIQDTSFIVINRTEKDVSFWCPKSVLRTGTKQQYQAAAKIRKLNSEREMLYYVDRNIQEFTPYVNLFYSLGEHKEAYASEYLFLQRNTEAERQTLYEDRKKLFRIFEERFQYDMTFFMESPAKVKWDKRGWFTIIDGLHRIYYLNYKGYAFYPVEATEEDFEKFCNYLKITEKSSDEFSDSGGGGGNSHSPNCQVFSEM